MAAYPFSRGKRNIQRRSKNYIRKNERIRCPEIRVIGPSGKMVGVMNPRDALKLAKDAGLDLVEVSPSARPPVCRILDFGKFKYELSKKKKDTTKTVIRLKEIKFRVSTGQHDYETKLRRAEQFLAHGHKVKLTLTFRGREMEHQNLGYKVLQKSVADLDTMGSADSDPRKAGRNLSVMVAPLPKQKQQLKFSKKVEELADDEEEIHEEEIDLEEENEENEEDGEK
jgi:translation initiation factor IF-3